jgi:hypothetical protein
MKNSTLSENAQPGLFSFSEAQLVELRNSPGPFGKYLHAASLFYLQYHRNAYESDGESSTIPLLRPIVNHDRNIYHF